LKVFWRQQGPGAAVDPKADFGGIILAASRKGGREVLKTYIFSENFKNYTINTGNFKQKVHSSMSENTQHELRLSLDIHSLTQNNFKGNIYVKNLAYPALGIP
jgi:hypothetical protein